MALKIGQELLGPGDVEQVGSSVGAVGAGSGAPVWAVGNPVAIAMSGLQNAVSAFAATYDDVQVSSFNLQKQQELDEKYFHPETGLFNTRKGAAAQGLYNEFAEDAKRIVSQDAVRQLSDRQRKMANRSLSALFTDFGHKVADFENTQLMNHQMDTAKNNIFNAIEIVAKSGNLDVDALGMSYANIQNNNIALGKMSGWDEDTIVRKTREDFGEAIVKGATAASVSDPTKAYGALRTFKDVVPSDKYQAAIKNVVGQWNDYTMQQFFDIYENQGTNHAKGFLDSVSMAGQAARRAAKEESGGKPDAVNLSDSRGTSVGLYQIHRGPKSDTMSEFEKFLRKNGKGDVADQLKGKQGKELGDAWKELVNSGRIEDQDQTDFIQENLITPAFRKLPEGLQQRINASSPYQDALWSTAIQHGDTGAVRLMKRAWEDSGTDNRKFFESLYDARKTQFGSQPKHIQEAIAKRMEREKARAIGELSINPETGESQFPRDELVLTPQKYLQAMRMMRTREREKSTLANRLMKENFPNAVQNFLQFGDVTGFDEVEEALIQTGDDKAFISFKTQRAKYQELLPFMQSNADKSFAEQQFLAMEWLTKAVIPGIDGNADAINKMKEDVSKSLKSQMDTFKKDPAGYAAEIQRFKEQKAQQDLTVPPKPEMKDGQEPTETDVAKGLVELGVKENMRIQEQLSGDPTFIPNVISQEQQKKWKTYLNDDQISSQSKFDLAMNLSTMYGVYTEKALSELGLNGGANAAVTMAQQLGPSMEPIARELFAASMVPDSAIWTEEQRKLDILPKARENKLVTFVNNVISNVGISSNAAKQALDLTNSVAKMIALGREDKLNELTDGFDYSNIERGVLTGALGLTPVYANAVLRIPKSLNVAADDVAYGLGRITANDLQDLIPEIVKGEAGDRVIEEYNRGIEAMKQGITWVSTDGGQRVMAFFDGEIVPARKKVNGKFVPLTLDIMDVIKKHGTPSSSVSRIVRWTEEDRGLPPSSVDSEFFGTGIYAPVELED